MPVSHSYLHLQKLHTVLDLVNSKVHKWAEPLFKQKKTHHSSKLSLQFLKKYIYEDKHFDIFNKLCLKYTLFPPLSVTLQLGFVCLGRAADPVVSFRAAAVCRCERQGSRIYAVSFAGWARSIIKNVPKMSTALKEKKSM